MPDLERWVAVGSIVKPHGVHGELRVRLYNAESDVLLQIDTVRIRRQGAPETLVSIQTARPASGGFVLIAFEGVHDRDAAEALRGGVVEVPRQALPPPDPGEFYVCDILGAHAVLPDGTPIGTVVDFQAFPSTQVLVVEHDGRRFDVPLVDDFVQSVDVDAQRVVISSLDGLESG